MLGFVMMGCVNKTDLVVEDLDKSDNSSLEVLEQVYNIASCVIETYKLSYEYEKFAKEIGNRKTPLPPHLTAEAMAFGSECSQIEQFKIKQKQLNPKDSV